MKPLPTLTKPLRSVDLATKEPAAALRERTDSCTVPAAGVVGEAMVALVLAAAYRDKLGGDHIDDAARGPARLRGAHRVEPGALATAPLVLVGFMGAGKSTGARALAAELGAEALDSDRELEQRARRADRVVLRPRGRGRLPRARGGGRLRAARPRRTPR